MRNSELISIVIPLYNKENCIRNTVEKILHQPYKNIEVIIVDDGSTDNSLVKLRGISDARIRIFTKSNGGPSSARNMGVRKANGEWIYFIDADDQIEDNTLQNFSLIMQENKDVSVFVANYYMKKGSLFKKHTIFMKNGIVKNNFRAWFWEILTPCQGAVLYKKEILEKYPYPEEIRRWEDASMFFEVMKKEKIYLVDFPAFIYNLDAASASHGRENINEDFLGHLTLNADSFWERMAYMLLYEQAISLYPKQVVLLYGKKPYGVMDKIFYSSFIVIKWGLRIIAKVVNTIKYS